MSIRTELTADLRQVADAAVLQEDPYPVVVPRSADAAARVIGCARTHQFSVMVLGSGSSFPPDFSVLRDNVLAVMTVGLTGMRSLSPATHRVASGTALSSVLDGADLSHKTVGGFLCDIRRRQDRAAFRGLWSRVRSLEVITATGELQRLAGPSAVTCGDHGAASCYPGSRGRLGLVTAIEFFGPLPITVPPAGAEDEQDFDHGTGEVALDRKDLQSLFDGNSVFHW